MTKRKKKGKHPYSHSPLEIETPVYYNNSKYDLEIRTSQIPDGGMGVFTNEFIPEKVIIGQYEGEIMKRNIHCSRYFFYINDLKGIDALSYPRCYMAMLNDAYKSIFTNNCEFIVDENDIVTVWSTIDILPNTELFVHYGDDYFKN